jgi:hypothetical protein
VRPAPRNSLPRPLPGWITPELIVETRAAWQPYYEEDLTDEQAVALLIPVGVLYEILFSGDAVHEEETDDGGDEEVHRARPRE